MTIVRLISASALPVLFAVIFYLLDRKTSFKKLPFMVKQLIIGVIFGVISALATEFGIPVEDTVLNVRNAPPLTAGLIFGAPAGIIAGLIGGLHRWFCVYWGSAGYVTQLVCTLATIFAGFFGAFCRKFMFESKKPSWVHGLVIGVSVEVFHMLLLFLNSMDDIALGFSYVEKCSLPMILANSISVAVSLLIVSLIGREKRYKQKRTKKNLAQTFQFFLLICVIISFSIAGIFTVSLQTRLAYENVDFLLSINLEDVKSDIIDASDSNLLKIARNIKADLGKDITAERFALFASKYDVSEINLVDPSGKITISTNPDYVGFDMSKGEQSSEFLALNDRIVTEYVQEYGPISHESNVYMKYAAVLIGNDGSFLQVGYDESHFRDDLAEKVRAAAHNRHIGKDGYVIVCDSKFRVVSSPHSEQVGEKVSFDSDYDITQLLLMEGERFEAKSVMEYTSYCMFMRAEGYYIVATYPIDEAMFTRDISVYVTVFMLLLVFMALFIHIYFLIKRLVVDNIHKINDSLSQITRGNLDVKVDVRGNEEFTYLSDDINKTVDTLKQYIDEAKARIDKDLEFAKNIQQSALPSVFPPFPNRHDFEIYATMAPAKEVGGDFYDFSLLDNDKLGFIIADVSGKSIPGAMFMMRSKTLIKNLMQTGMDVGEIMTLANNQLCEGNDAGMFVTAWLGIADMRSGVLHYANAGHNPPLIRHKNGKFEYLRARPNFVLAGIEHAKYRTSEYKLLPGDEIFLYTDGVTEATNPKNEMFGEDRLLDALNVNPSESVESRCKSLKLMLDRFADGAEQSDDITMLTVKLNFFQNFESITTSPDSESVSNVWDFINYKLYKTELPKKLENRVKIVLDEIYSNILRYSKATEARVKFSIDEKELILTFEDNGIPYDPLAKEDPDITLSVEEREIGGLGIFMVKKMATSLSYNNVEGINTLEVHFDR